MVRPEGFEPPTLGSEVPRSLRAELRAHRRRQRSGLIGLVPGAGVEPARALSPRDFESLASASSATPARYKNYSKPFLPTLTCGAVSQGSSGREKRNDDWGDKSKTKKANSVTLCETRPLVKARSV